MLAVKKKLIVGNWKMHKTIAETIQFIDELSATVYGSNNSVFLAVPFTALASAAIAAEDSKIIIGAQNLNEQPSGAYTGEISAAMVKDAGAEFVILGHSERRQIYHESNIVIHEKIKQALAHKLQPIICVGETREQREHDETESVLAEQIQSAFKGLSIKDFSDVIIAYEPVWAIGTGLVASIEMISSVHMFCREQVSKALGHLPAARLKVIYGGSVNDSNAKLVILNDNVDGVLVGSASLSVDSFTKIVNTQNSQPHKSCRCTS